MKSLTIAYISNREQCHLNWFSQSLRMEGGEKNIRIFCVGNSAEFPNVNRITPKPSIWSGESRLTKENWWSKSNSLNTALALCETEWFCQLDDRCVLMRGWLDAIKQAMDGNYIVCGAYEKRTAMTVENGVIKNAGIVIGKDDREQYCETYYKPNGMKPPYPAARGWLYGCSVAYPLEWALQVNGYPEDYCDSLGMEDVVFGMMLQNAGYPMKYDPRMKIIEDRTPSEIGPATPRTDKGKSPADKSHKILEIFKESKTSLNSFDLRTMRKSVLSGNPFPKPSASNRDWYDGQLVSEFQVNQPK